MSRLSLSQRSQLIVAAIGASLLTAALLNLYPAHTRRVKRKQLDQDVLGSLSAYDSLRRKKTVERPESPPQKNSNSHSSQTGQSLGYDENLVREQLARNYTFFGEAGMQNIRRGNVVVVESVVGQPLCWFDREYVLNLSEYS